MGEGRTAHHAARWLAIGAVVYPWLHAGAAGPLPAVEAGIVSFAGVLVLLAIAAWRSPSAVPRSLVLTPIAAAVLLWAADAAARREVVPTPSVAIACIVFAAMTMGAIVVRTGDRVEWARCVASGWLVAAIASTGIALMQRAGIESSLGSWAAYSPLHHAFANLRQRNHFATLACIGLVSAVWLGTQSRDATTRIVVACAAAFVSLGLAASASRTGLVEVIAVIALWLTWREGAYRRWALLIAVGYGIAALLLFITGGVGLHGVLDRLAGDAPDCQGRRVLWATVLELIGERPWTGWGWDGLPLAVYRSSTQPHFCALVENAHDLPLHLAVTLGVPVAFLAGAAAVFAAIHVRLWRPDGEPPRLGVPVLAVLAVHSMLEYPLWYGPFQMAFGLALGLVWRQGVLWRVPRLALAASWAAGAAIAAYVAFDYARVSQPFLAPEERWRPFANDALVHAQRSWLFADVARYAQLAALPLTPQTAARVHALSGETMRFEPVPFVVSRRIASARMLGLDAEADDEARRLRAAYPL